jgi:hypothetical protein
MAEKEYRMQHSAMRCCLKRHCSHCRTSTGNQGRIVIGREWARRGRFLEEHRVNREEVTRVNRRNVGRVWVVVVYFEPQ